MVIPTTSLQSFEAANLNNVYIILSDHDHYKIR